MNFINYISTIAVPFTIFFIILHGFSKKVNVFDSFLVGAQEGIHTVIKIFPTLIALFLAVNALRNSGILDLLSNILSPLLSIFNFPSEILPLALIRPISGSAATAVALDIMETYGVDTIIRHNFFNNYGLYRNHFVYYSNIYKCCRYKKYSFCTYFSTHC